MRTGTTADHAAPPPGELPALTAELATALLREVGHTWAELNQNHFARRLLRPSFALIESRRRLGQWDGGSRTLSLSQPLVLERPWAVVREVIKHEMAHQFVDEVLGVRDETAHGPAFLEVCRARGFDGAAAGEPAGAREGSEPDAELPALRRVARLLALAESPNQHEAEAAMKAASRLMLKHNIDVVAAQGRRSYAFRHLGHPRRRIEAHEHVLAGLLAKHFFVEVIWVPSYEPATGRSGRVLELCGTDANLQVAEYAHGFVLATAERLWRAHRRDQRLPGDRHRRRFLLGVINGFGEKLREGRDESQREGLVYVGDSQLRGYFRARYPRTSGGSSFTFERTATYEAGRAAGKAIVLHRPVSTGSAQRGRLLTGG